MSANINIEKLSLILSQWLEPRTVPPNKSAPNATDVATAIVNAVKDEIKREEFEKFWNPRN